LITLAKNLGDQLWFILGGQIIFQGVTNMEPELVTIWFMLHIKKPLMTVKVITYKMAGSDI